MQLLAQLFSSLEILSLSTPRMEGLKARTTGCIRTSGNQFRSVYICDMTFALGDVPLDFAANYSLAMAAKAPVWGLFQVLLSLFMLLLLSLVYCEFMFPECA